MNSSKILIATTLVALIGAGSAFAAEGTQDFTAGQTLSSQSRAEVLGELAAARRDGTASYREATPAPIPASTVTRTQVIAEAREAMRLGLASSNEGGQHIATPTEQESVRLAGLSAIESPRLARAAQ
jgi:hypothetical protein